MYDSFVRVFFLKYETFTTADILLEKLLQRCALARALELIRWLRFLVPKHLGEERRVNIQLQVISILMLWIETYPKDLSTKLVQRLAQFHAQHAPVIPSQLDDDGGYLDPAQQGKRLAKLRGIKKNWGFLFRLGTELPKRLHRGRINTYRDAFTGEQAVTWMIANVSNVKDTNQAVELGEDLLGTKILKNIRNGRFKNLPDEIYQFMVCFVKGYAAHFPGAESRCAGLSHNTECGVRPGCAGRVHRLLSRRPEPFAVAASHPVLA